MNLTEDSTCRLCLDHDETAEHILCECEALAYHRQLFFSKAIILPAETASADPKDLVSFIKSVRIKWEL